MCLSCTRRGGVRTIPYPSEIKLNDTVSSMQKEFATVSSISCAIFNLSPVELICSDFKSSNKEFRIFFIMNPLTIRWTGFHFPCPFTNSPRPPFTINIIIIIIILYLSTVCLIRLKLIYKYVLYNE